MRFLEVDTLEAAREKLQDFAFPALTDAETVALTEAQGRILAVDVYSTEPIPDFRRSTVDGYAVRSRDTQGCGENIPVFLDLIEEIAIGTAAIHPLQPGQCSYVPTGGMLPEGADAMVMVEYTEMLGDTMVAISSAVSAGRNVVQIGEDAPADTLLLSRGSRLDAREIGVLASLGYKQVQVFRPWRVTILSTGDELVQPGEKKHAGQVFDVNSYSIAAMAKKAGMDVVHMEQLPDDAEQIESAMRNAMQNSEILVTSGGSSQGKKDLTANLFDKIASPGVWGHGLALKPGKPTILGGDRESQTILAGLPGHPVAAMIVFELMILWLQRNLQGQNMELPIPARMESNVPAAAGRATCQPVKLVQGPDGYIARPVHGKSGLMRTLTQADGYVMLEVNQEGLKTDEPVLVHRL